MQSILYQEIPYQTPQNVFEPFSQTPGNVLLESSMINLASGQYSIIGIDPFAIIKKHNGTTFINKQPTEHIHFFSLLKQCCQENLLNNPNLPVPFVGGAIGLLSYDLKDETEHLSSLAKKDINWPDGIFGLYDLLIVFNHKEKEAWIISNGLPEKGEKRLERAKDRLNNLWGSLQKKTDKNTTKKIKKEKIIIKNDFTEEDYKKTVAQTKDYILNGDIFEANISQRFIAKKPAEIDNFSIYQQLTQINPAPFSAFIHFNELTIASSSPERFIKIEKNNIETRPIKGTRPRGKTKKEDQALANELLNSKKDHAENTMIVDLMRNDLSKICEIHSINVPQHCKLERYASVHHLVSVIQGKLKQSLHPVDALKMIFPGGSITGAPKIRAMEIIEELEPTKRGPYTGSIAYIGFDNYVDASILIRSFAIQKDTITFQAGGAIILDSNPEEEYLETHVKAAALKKTLLEINQI